MYKIFIVEDDAKIAAILKSNMEKYGFEAAAAVRFRELMPEFEAFGPQLVLLDINLPYFDGYYWCRQIRARSSVPIIFISARAGEMDQVMAIENGGDDYVTKPIHLDLLMAKVKSVLRRTYGEYAAAGAGSAAPGDAHGTVPPELAAGGLRLLLARGELEWRGRRVELTKNEQLLAEYLLKRPGEVVSREHLLEALWDDVQFVDDNTLSVNVTRLRKKLEELGLQKAIETVRGLGYKLVPHGLGGGGSE
ncbi:response regulator transcription factor [Paenibacillus arenilitoris]|uniref:Response regulator transcription factor n=1 Tax=Paenibacillus arenilitoris TaxID=2772299 RepID=A0A927CJ90_9BACL|nr:response regulator transcription factor [Paenibacillus arenilitoris]MBD2868107.1 response regulator transcription factor [Paenibacillus arenilitoris]